MSKRGAVAAGHPLTAEAGAAILREGGNAVDAAVAAVLTSFVTESPLTGLGAGGFMLVHSGDEDVLLDFFVEVPGRGEALERYGAEGGEPFSRGEIARRVSECVLERGGTLTTEDLAAYAPVARE